jgi:hypothetical protein
LRTFHRYFLPSFASFGHVVQRRRFLEIDQSETRIACGGNMAVIGNSCFLLFNF